MKNLSNFPILSFLSPAITPLLVLNMVLILAIILLGGLEIKIGNLEITVHHLKTPFCFLLSLLLLKFWIDKKTGEQGIIKRAETFLEQKHGIFAFAFLAFISFIWIKVSQHYSFRTGAFDLSMYDYALSNTIKGKFMYTPWLGRNFFSEHFSPILLLLVPFYFIYDGPIVLVVTQAVITVLSAFPLYILAKEKLNQPITALCISVAYLTYHYLVSGLMFDFHMEIFELLFIFSAFLFLHRNKPGKYFIFLILALACKEDVPLYMFGLGIYAWLIEKKKKIGLATMLICIVWAFVAWKIVIPMSYPDGPRVSHFLARWSKFGQTYSQIAWGLLTHPSELFGAVFFTNFKNLLLPLGFTPIASPALLSLSIPPMLINVTSENPMMRNLDAHYALPIIPFVFIAAIFGINNICKMLPQKRNIILTIFSLYILAMNLGGLKGKGTLFTTHDMVGHKLIASLPDTASIAAQTSIIPHLRHSQNIQMLPKGLNSDYIFFDTKRFIWPMTDEEYNALINSFINNPDYMLLSGQEGFYLFKKKLPSE